NTIEQIRSLTERAIGFTASRGDTISVANAPFNNEALSVPVWQDPFYQEAAKALAQYLILTLLIAFAWFKIAKPILNRYGINFKPVESPQSSAPDMTESLPAQDLANEALKITERY